MLSINSGVDNTTVSHINSNYFPIIHNSSYRASYLPPLPAALLLSTTIITLSIFVMRRELMVHFYSCVRLLVRNRFKFRTKWDRGI